MVSEVFTKGDKVRIKAIVEGFFASCEDDKKYRIEIKENRKKRSMDANAYYWVLVHKIAEEAQVSVETVYREHVQEIGGNNDLLCIQNCAVEDFCKAWSMHGLGWITELMPSKLAGCTNVMVYYGSSTYDTRQMSRLIDMAIQDCREYGIEYMTPEEIAAMLDRWEDNHEG